MRRAERRRWAPVLLAAALGTAGPAAAGDPGAAPIEIRADRLTVEHGGAVLIYQGNVSLTQDGLAVQADTLTVHRDASGLQSLSIEGRPGAPARFEHRRPDGRRVRGRAQHLRYEPAAGRLRLEGDAWLDNGSGELASDRIDYELDAGRFEAGGERGVRMRLLPAGAEP
ncbi:MAG: hypothetical protein KatS3mg121_0561 [Gammaproteobacteria bacterium]|nr:MAG: hypothetical protein KatS3mg121_0561 [Gammaproteobacteria bacterium]